MRMPPDPSLVERLNRQGQAHLLRWWDDLDEDQRARLVSEVESIDLGQLDRLLNELVKHDAPTAPDPDRVGPIEVCRLPQTDGERVARRHVAEIGASALAAGEVAVVLVAGGSGAQLGYARPQGAFPN